MADTDDVVAVIGGSGLAGGATVDALLLRGVRVRVLSRTGAPRDGVESIVADATDVDRLTHGLQGATVAVLCARPAYWRWPQELVPMVEVVAEACRRVGARLVYCDNLYAYGVPEGPLHEASPLRPHGPKGHARLAAARALETHHDKGHLELAIGRAADFWGPRVDYPNVKMVFDAALRGATVRILGAGTTPHSTSFVPDVGRGLATLALAQAAFGRVWHLPAIEPVTERAFAERVAAIAGAGSTVSVVPNRAVRALLKVTGLVNPMMRELQEVLYQHELPFVVDDARFRAAFGEQATTLDDAIRATLRARRSELSTDAAARAA